MLNTNFYGQVLGCHAASMTQQYCSHHKFIKSLKMMKYSLKFTQWWRVVKCHQLFWGTVLSRIIPGSRSPIHMQSWQKKKQLQFFAQSLSSGHRVCLGPIKGAMAHIVPKVRMFFRYYEGYCPSLYRAAQYLYWQKWCPSCTIQPVLWWSWRYLESGKSERQT